MIWYIFRHGQTDANVHKLLSGRLDVPLNQAGIRTLEEMYQQGVYPKDAQLCYTSTLQRAQQTASIILPGVPQQEEAMLDEISFGEYEGVCPRDMLDDPVFMAWYTGHNDAYRPRGGESFPDVRARSWEAVKAIYRQTLERKLETVALVGHGGFWGEFMLHCLKVPGNKDTVQLKNGCGLAFSVTGTPDAPVFRLLRYIGAEPGMESFLK